MSNSENIHIKHAENDDENRTDNFKLDGFDEEWNTEKWNWFCSEDTETLPAFRGEFITKKQ